MRKERQSNIELLRCLLMFMIVVIHFIAHNILEKDNSIQYGDPNFISSNILLSLCICAVNTYVIISGYFGIKLSFRKVALFLLPIAFYEAILSLCFYKWNGQFSFSPFNYWFVKSYFALMLISPILNKGLNMLSKKELRNLLFLCIVFFILPIMTISGNAGKNVFIFIILYMTGYYIRNYYVSKLSTGVYLVLFFCGCSLIVIETLLFVKLGKYNGAATLSYCYDSIVVYMTSVLLFLAFTQFKIKSKLINYLATSCFFVYIITENQNMYKHPNGIYDIIKIAEYSSSALYPIWILLYSIVFFGTSIIIDKIRVAILGNIENQIGNYIDKLQLKLSKE